MPFTLTKAQQAVVENEGGALLVSAAAGSGKTRVLIDRLLRKIADGANIDDFLIITYTNAAAAELRAKIFAALSERLAEQPENRHLQRQLTRIYLTQISTVHAFCANILRRYAHTMDLPPDFRVAEEYEMQLLRDRVLDDVLEEAYAHLGDLPDVAAAIDRLGYGRDDRRLAALVLRLYDSVRCQVDPDGWMTRCEAAYTDLSDAGQTPWGVYWLERLHASANDAAVCLQDAIAISARDDALAEKYIPLFERNLETVRAYAVMSTWNEVYAAATPDFGRLPVVRKAEDLDAKERAAALRKSALSLLRDALDAFYGDSETVCRDLAASFRPLSGLFTLVQQFDKAFQKARRQRRLLDFSDLEHEAIRLLTDRYTGKPTAAAREIASGYREILVDEYQDSNAIQETIFQAVSQSGQNLFMVGDVKQSIYRFRLADPDIFLRKYSAYPDAADAAPGEPRKLLLSDNFRSREELLAAANDVFSLVMNRESCELDYGEAERLRAGMTFPPVEGPLVELHCINLHDGTDDDGPGLEKVQEEAAFVARRIAQLLNGGCMVAEGEGLRPAKPGDIVILMRSPGMAANTYQRALADRGIDSVSDRGGSILDTSEAEIFLALLAILDNPHQDVPLATVLASPVFGFSPDELAAPRTLERDTDYYGALRAMEPKPEKLTRFLTWLDDIRPRLDDLPLPELIDAIFDSTDLLDVFSALPDGVQRAKNLAALRDLAIAAGKNESCTLFSFRTQLAQMKERGILPPAADAARENAVRIMSIHKSKGLEFPIVVLADLSRRFNLQDNTASVLTDPSLLAAGLAADLEAGACWPTIAHMAISDKKTRQSVAEELRVLYVAMTRAKERLIMTYCSAQLESTLKKWNAALSLPLRPFVSAQARRLGDWVLMEALCRTESGAMFAEAGPNEWSRPQTFPWRVCLHDAAGLHGWQPPEQTAKPETETPLSPELAAAALDRSYAHLAATHLPSKLTATQLKGRLLDAEAAEEAYVRSAPPPTWRTPQFLQTTPLQGREKGNATHLFMQFARYEACTAEEPLRAELARLQDEWFLTPRQAEAVDLAHVLRLFASPLGARILSARALRREFKFSILTDAADYDPAAAGEEVLLQGVVDCFWDEPEGLVILDFKTDRIHGDLDAKAARYAPQLAAYAAALSRIFERPVKETLLYFFDCDAAVHPE